MGDMGDNRKLLLLAHTFASPRIPLTARKVKHYQTINQSINQTNNQSFNEKCILSHNITSKYQRSLANSKVTPQQI